MKIVPDPNFNRCLFLPFLLFVAGCQTVPVDQTEEISSLKPVSMFDGANRQQVAWSELFVAMDEADIIVIGESHRDPMAHQLQIDIISLAVERWDDFTLSLEEFDRSQQAVVDTFARGDMTAIELKETRRFVDLQVKENWEDWFLPKLEIARDSDTPMLASNAPLKYSRLVRNNGCDNLPELEPAERQLFECPILPVDPQYRERFASAFRQATRGRRDTGLKVMKDEQIDRLLSAHRVWDATMADTVADAHNAGADKVLHIVGEFHSKFNGGFVQELQARAPDANILVISMVGKKYSSLISNDVDRADIVIYTRT